MQLPASNAHLSSPTTQPYTLNGLHTVQTNVIQYYMKRYQTRHHHASCIQLQGAFPLARVTRRHILAWAVACWLGLLHVASWCAFRMVMMLNHLWLLTQWCDA